MSAADGVSLVVDVSGRMIRVQHQLLDIGRAEMKHARFMVVDPHDGVKVMAAHGRYPFARMGLVFSLEHDLFGKPASTFPDHALEPGAISSSIDDHLADRPQRDAGELD